MVTKGTATIGTVNKGDIPYAHFCQLSVIFAAQLSQGILGLYTTQGARFKSVYLFVAAELSTHLKRVRGIQGQYSEHRLKHMRAS